MAIESLSINDLLENINILLKFIISQKCKNTNKANLCKDARKGII